MALGRYLVEAVVLERRSVSELARRHGVSRYWIYKLLKRFHEGGFAALEPRSRRPKTCAHETAASVQAEILQLRQELSEAGHDAGPQTIAHHLIGRAEPVPSAATIWRILKRHGVVTPQPHKRPRCSFIRFEAKLPNETWQCDATAWPLADGSPVEILNIDDDPSRLSAPSSTRHSSASWASSRLRTRFPSCSSNSTPSATTTTSDGPIVPWASRHRWLCSTPASRPDLICQWSPLTTESARTASTPSAKSRCAIWVDSAISRRRRPPQPQGASAGRRRRRSCRGNRRHLHPPAHSRRDSPLPAARSSLAS